MSGLGGMLGGRSIGERLKSAKPKALTKGRRQKNSPSDPSSNAISDQQLGERLFKQDIQQYGHGQSEQDSAQFDANHSQDEDAAESRPQLVAKRDVWHQADRKKAAAQKAADSAAEEQRRFDLSAQQIEDTLEAIPVVLEAESASTDGPGELTMAAPPSAAGQKMDAYRALGDELNPAPVTWSVDGVDVSALAHAVLLSRAAIAEEDKAEDWDSLYNAVSASADPVGPTSPGSAHLDMPPL